MGFAAVGPLHPELAALGLLCGILLVATARAGVLRPWALAGAPVSLLGVLVSSQRYPVGYQVVVLGGLGAGLLLGEVVRRHPDRRAAEALDDGAERYLTLALGALLVADAVVWLCVPDTEGALLVGAALTPVVADQLLGATGRRPSWLPDPSALGVRAQLGAVAAWTALVAVAAAGGAATLPATASVARAVVVPTLAVLAAVAGPLVWLVTSGRARPRR